ncbi:MAG: vancomycin high temperature exclusion protein [Phycisphaerales bacterium]|nr:YdcF family protein [Phycisphaeraceae bacterium]
MKYIARIAKSRVARRLLLAGAVCAGLGVAGLFACDQWIESSTADRLYSVANPPPQVPVGLVLGTSPTLPNGRKNLFFSARIEAAAQLYRDGRVQHLLVSGDNRHHAYDEPTAMRDALIALGVPAGDITLDFAGFRTLDSVVRARSVFGQSKFIVVSQQFHCQRAIFLARAHGIDAIGYCAAEPTGAAATRVRLREVLARATAILDVHVLNTGPHFPGPPEPIVLADAHAK